MREASLKNLAVLRSGPVGPVIIDPDEFHRDRKPAGQGALHPLPDYFRAILEAMGRELGEFTWDQIQERHPDLNQSRIQNYLAVAGRHGIIQKTNGKAYTGHPQKYALTRRNCKTYLPKGAAETIRAFARAHGPFDYDQLATQFPLITAKCVKSYAAAACNQGWLERTIAKAACGRRQIYKLKEAV